MNIHKNPNLLVNQLKKTEGVHGVSYEYPGFWEIDTELGLITLGDENGIITWNAFDASGYLEGETSAKTPATIARDFGAWLRGEF